MKIVFCIFNALLFSKKEKLKKIIQKKMKKEKGK